ncbi:MAG: copper resistance protein B [Salinisphaera sp.]|jgi:copper resistance protein B|nr:copper resistance protein B [Salinisphaera sp.]
MPELMQRTRMGIALVLASVALPAAAANPPGKANPNSVVPGGAANPSSGAPANWTPPIHDDAIHQYTSINRLEYGTGNAPSSYLWEGQGWVGGDINRFWWKTEGEGANAGGSPDSTSFEADYGRAITPFWNALIGGRYDLYPSSNRAFGMLKLQGLTPLYLDTELSVYVSQDGVPSFRGEFQYEPLISQRLRLAPRAEINIGARDAGYGLGGGLQNTQLGLRLKYQVRRELVPYIGVRWEQKYGDTADIARAEGQNTSSTAFVVGLSAWY